MRLLVSFMIFAILLGINLDSAFGKEIELRHRWLFVMRDMSQSENLAATLDLLPRAQAAGYNAIVLSDSNLFELKQLGSSYRDNILRLQQEAKQYGLELIPSVMPIGYSGAILGYDRNLAEGIPVKDGLFIVHNGEAVSAPDPPVALAGDFEQVQGDAFAGWDFQENEGKSVFADHTVFHSGRTSVRMERIPEFDPQWGHCRFSKMVKVKPFRQYHLSAWIKTEDFEAPESARITVLAPTEEERALSYGYFPIERTQEWRQYHLVFNSLNFDEVNIYFGTWEGKGGRIWWDDLALEEIGLHNVLRREGCPLEVRSEEGTVYAEGVDFEPIRDPELRPWVTYHTPPTFRIMPNSHIKDGTRLRVSYYHSLAIGDAQVMCCFSDPKVYEILREQVRQVNDLLHPSSFFMQHDEIRVANWDKACQDRRLTPGQLLADNVRRCFNIIHEINPEAKVWVWSDMFDPFHNAVDNYYLVNGSWAGSWEGLAPEIGIVNWGGHLKGDNLKWFSARGHEQVLAGYYDYDRDGNAIRAWLAAGLGVSKVNGAMYTTWENNYDFLAPWAKAAWDSQTEGARRTEK